MSRPRILPEDDGEFRREFHRLGGPGMAVAYGVTEAAVYKAIKDRRLTGLVKAYRRAGLARCMGCGEPVAPGLWACPDCADRY